MDTISNEMHALALYLGIETDELKQGYDDNHIEYGNQEYIVADDDQAQALWNESIDQYIDDCVLSELPEQYRNYFDNEAFKKDCSYDGRGHSLAGYDGDENEQEYNSVTYYIYRTN